MTSIFLEDYSIAVGYISNAISFYSTEPNQSTKIAHCGRNYSRHCYKDGMVGTIGYVLFRVAQAFFAIFGRSDWQMAKKQLVTQLRFDFSEQEINEEAIEQGTDFKFNWLDLTINEKNKPRLAQDLLLKIQNLYTNPPVNPQESSDQEMKKALVRNLFNTAKSFSDRERLRIENELMNTQ